MTNETSYLPTFSSETERRSSTSSSNWESRHAKKRDKRKRIDKQVSTKSTSFKRKDSMKRDLNTSSSPFDSSPKSGKRGTRFSKIFGAAKIKPSTHEQHTICKKRMYDDETR